MKLKPATNVVEEEKPARPAASLLISAAGARESEVASWRRPAVLADRISGRVPYAPASVARAKSRSTTVTPRRVYAYVRFSSSNQRETSLERQEENIRFYCGNNGLIIDAVFADHAVGGTVSERAGLDRLLAACAAHPGSIVVVENVDRLFRNMQEYGRILLEFGKSSTTIHDTSGHNSPLVEAVKAGVASEDRIRLLDRVAMGKVASAKAGKWIATKIPYGYRRSGPTEIEIDEKTAANVVLMFELKAGGMNYRQLSDELHARGIRPPLSDRWNTATLRKILRNGIYVGWCVWNLTRPIGHQ